MTALRPALESLETREQPAAAFQTLPAYPYADAAAADHVRAIAVEGTLAGRNSNAFLKIGDSNSALFGDDSYLRPLGDPGYDAAANGLTTLGASIVETWATFRGSFGAFTMAAYPGHDTNDVLYHLGGAIAATNPATALIMIGTNDATLGSPPDDFRYRYDLIVNQLLDAKIVLILSTIPENLAFGDGVTNLARAYNQEIANISERYRLPLWNFHGQLAALPSAGLAGDRLHLSVSPNGGAKLQDQGFGQNLHNVGALTMLDWYRRIVSDVPPTQSMPSFTSLAGRTVYAVGLDRGQAPVVSIYDANTHQEVNRFYAFEPSFTGGVRVATGDVNGDSIPDIVCGAGPGGGPAVNVFSGADGSRLASFFAYEGSFRGGVGSVAARDLDGDGLAEIAVGAGNGGGPAVAVFAGGTFRETSRFFAFDSSFRGGVNVALAHLEGLGSTIVAGAGVGGGAHVKVFDAATAAELRSFFASDPAFRGGIAVAAGDLTGDGWDEVAAGRASGVALVGIFDAVKNEVLRWLPIRTANPIAGIRLGAIANGGARSVRRERGGNLGSTGRVLGLGFRSVHGPAALAAPRLRHLRGVTR